jgi:hypothetical protein
VARNDFGDGWEHAIKIKRLADLEAGAFYPRLIEASGRCPPEDVGGPWGYGEMLKAISDPKHERRAEIRAWLAEDFDPKLVDIEALTNNVSTLAKKWSPKKSPTKRRPQA